MNITLILTGKTTEKYLEEGINNYSKRLLRYIKFKIIYSPDLRRNAGLSENELKKRESIKILELLKPSDYVVLLDERGKDYSSPAFAKFLNEKMCSGLKNLVFVIGGAYGFDETIYQRSDMQLSLSKMTFSHQMVRLFFIEQCYRAFTILNNEPYHHY
jgi:23S rRNA (pseudouridine1915-N3)-methyltransferase